MNPKLVQLYKQMYEMTEPECRLICRCPQACCSPEYCGMARVCAEAEGVYLEVTCHPTLPYMGLKGCTVPPHLRPICTVHVCSINALGFKPGDQEWTQKYFELREEIVELEFADVLLGDEN